MILLPSFLQLITKNNSRQKPANNQSFSTIILKKYDPHSTNTLQKKKKKHPLLRNWTVLPIFQHQITSIMTETHKAGHFLQQLNNFSKISKFNGNWQLFPVLRIKSTKNKTETQNRNRQRRRLYGTWLGDGTTHDLRTDLIRRIDQTLGSDWLPTSDAEREKEEMAMPVLGTRKRWFPARCPAVCPSSRDVAWWRGELTLVPEVYPRRSAWWRVKSTTIAKIAKWTWQQKLSPRHP